MGGGTLFFDDVFMTACSARWMLSKLSVRGASRLRGMDVDNLYSTAAYDAGVDARRPILRERTIPFELTVSGATPG